MSVVRVKDGVLFSVIAPAGFRILSAIDQCAAKVAFDLTITSACDGLHSGPEDPHHKGEAYDIRTHDMPAGSKEIALAMIMTTLGKEKFYGFVEDPDGTNEHLHVQRAKGTVYP